jgi:hypothetical protein
VAAAVAELLDHLVLELLQTAQVLADAGLSRVVTTQRHRVLALEQVVMVGRIADLVAVAVAALETTMVELVHLVLAALVTALGLLGELSQEAQRHPVLVVMAELVMVAFHLLQEQPILVMELLAQATMLVTQELLAALDLSSFVTHTHKDRHVTFC